MKLIDILREINQPKPADAYPLSDPIKWTEGDLLVYKYNFSNRQGDDMSIETNFVPGKDEIYVIFYESKNAAQRNDDLKYGTKTGSGDMLKVLATVVEAVKRTANDLGGMQNVREILVQSDDPKRLNVYAHYAGTLFPDFTAKKIGSWIEMKNKKYNPEDRQLREIGETTAKPYKANKVDESSYYVTYEFETDPNDEGEKIQYIIVIGKSFKTLSPTGAGDEYDEDELQFIVSFGVKDSGSVNFQIEFNDVKNLFRVMATVVDTIKKAIAEEAEESDIPVTRIIIEPTKREIEAPGSAVPVYDKADTRRADLYKKFIEKNMPSGSKVRELGKGDKIIVDLPTE